MLWHKLGSNQTGGLTLTYIGTNEEATSGVPTITYSNQGIGAASDDRLVVVCVAIYDNNVGRITGVTLGGNAMTEDITYGSTSYDQGIFSYKLPSGTTADIVITHDGPVWSPPASSIAVYTITGSDTTAAVETDGYSGIGTFEFTLSASVNNPVILQATHGTTITWTSTSNIADFVEDVAIEVDSYETSYASGTISAVTATADPDVVTGTPRGVAAVYG